MNFDRAEQALTRARFHCHRFATGQDAARWRSGGNGSGRG